MATKDSNYDLTWVSGWLTLDYGDNLGHPGKDNPDNTNTIYLMKSLLWPSAKALGIWRCPADRSLCTEGSQRLPHVRTMSMNNWVGNYDPRTGADTQLIPNFTRTPGYKVITRIADMMPPAPVETFILLDEREDSIDDGYFVTDMTGDPLRRVIANFPSSYHNGAGGFNFGDGHSEVHKWRDAPAKASYRPDYHLTLGQSSPGNRDVDWLQKHATGRK